jgi:AraC family transcriptional regulator
MTLFGDHSMLQITIRGMATPAEPLIDTRIERTIRRIEADFHRALTLNTLAEEAHLSLFAFVRVFKRETGLSPWQFIIRCRIEASKSLLLSTHRAVAQIAFDVGWQNVSHFTAVFRRQVGTTPAMFRANARPAKALAA